MLLRSLQKFPILSLISASCQEGAAVKIKARIYLPEITMNRQSNQASQSHEAEEDHPARPVKVQVTDAKGPRALSDQGVDSAKVVILGCISQLIGLGRVDLAAAVDPLVEDVVVHVGGNLVR